MYVLLDTVSSYSYCFKYSISKFCYYNNLFCACYFITTELTNYCYSLIFSYFLLYYNSLPCIYIYRWICNSRYVHDDISCSFKSMLCLYRDCMALSMFFYYMVLSGSLIDYLGLYTFLIILFIFIQVYFYDFESYI